MSNESEAKAFRERKRLRGEGFGVENGVGGLQRKGLANFHEEVIGGADHFSFDLFGFDLLRGTHFFFLLNEAAAPENEGISQY